jgi:signal transduction histidine kinase
MSAYLLETVLEQGQPFDREYRIIRLSDNQVRWVHGLGRLEFDEEGRPIRMIGTIQDITERKQSEQRVLADRAQLKSLASQLSRIEERERHRLATALHDQIGQSLVFSKLKLDELRISGPSGDFSDALKEVCSSIEQVIQETRTLTFDLSSPILYELGFEAAVAEWLADEIEAKHGIETEFCDDGQEKPLDDDIRALLFRNVRELLINVVKHAQARKVKVDVRRTGMDVSVRVEDDGIGFDPAEVKAMAAKSDRFGLFSIRERLEQLGGLIEIDSGPDRGSRILMKAPLKCDTLTDGIEL